MSGSLVSVPLVRYQYRTCLRDRWIRLVQIHPHSGQGSLQCSLIEASIDSGVSFKALSYVWGDVKNVQAITCNGGALMVTRNLFAFLRHLQDSGESGFLWVDAICINQSDNREKTVQVRMMCEIYGKARSVVAWLGEEEEHDAAAFDLLRYICPKASTPGREETKEDISSWRSSTEELSQYPNIVKASVGLSSLWSRPWFSRVWIVQEMIVADNLTFRKGKNTVESEIFFRGSLKVMRSSSIMALTIGRIPPPDRIHWKNLINIYQIRLQVRNLEAEHGTQLIEIVNWTRSFKATDPRDNIYALVGLATDTSQDYIDYEMNLREVLIRLAKDGFSDARQKSITIDPVEFLSFAVTTNRKAETYSLPSWVPPFHDYPHDYSPLADCMFRMRLQDLITRTKFTFGANDTLCLSGSLHDTIKIAIDLKTHSPIDQFYGTMLEDGGTGFNMKQPLWNDNQLENLAVAVSLSEVRLEAVRNLQSYPTSEDPLDAYWRTLICNSLRTASKIGPSDDVIPPAEFREKWQAWEEYIRLQLEIVHKTSPQPFELPYGAYVMLRFLAFLLPLRWIKPLQYKSMIWDTLSGTFFLFVSELIYRLLYYVLQRALGFYFRYSQAARASKLEITARTFERRLQYTSGRKLCITENGYVGLVPEAAESGDQLLIVKGSRVLFVVCSYQEEYRLLGDAYIHGLMDGKACDLPNLKFQEIKLR